MPSPEESADSSAPVRLVRHERSGESQSAEDRVAVEEPLELRVEGRPIAVLMRTPGHDEELAAGFLLSEGLITQRQDLFEINRCPSVAGDADGNAVDVLLARPDPAKLERLTRHVFSASSCGICGKATIASVHQNFPPLENTKPAVTATTLLALPAAMLERQDSFRQTGGLHAAALVSREGAIRHLREDVGRHNAVDKILGRALLDRLLPLSEDTLFVSGRVSFEIVQKALAARIRVVAGVSAPTSLAVEFAQASGQTLVGFLRDGRFNIYSGAVA